MSRWPKACLADVTTHIKDGTHGTHARVESGVPFLSAKNIGEDGKVRWDDSDDLISIADYAGITSVFRPKRDDLLLTIVGSIGRAAIHDGTPLAFQRSVAFVRPSEKVSPAFLYQVSRSVDFFRQLERRSNVTAQAGLYLGELAKVNIPLPPIQAQHRIAAILSAFDKAIEATEALIAKHQQIKAGLMQDLFTRGVDVDGTLRKTAVEAPECYRQSAVGALPLEWQLVRLENAIRIVDCRHITPKYVADGLPVVRPRNVKVEGLDFDDIEYVTMKDFLHLTEPHPPAAGDVVFSRNASFGVPAYVEVGTRPFAIGQDVVVMTRSQANTRFVFYALQSDSAKRQIEIRSAGSTFARINLSDIRGLLIPLPPPREQERIAERLKAVGVVAQTLVQNLKKLALQKQGLMQHLLTGKVQVTGSDSR